MTDDDIAHRDEQFRQLAYSQGRRDADVDARLFSHEKRLNAINGSIEKHAQNAERLSRAIERTHDALESKIDTLLAAQATNAAIEADRQKNLQQSSEQHLNKRTFLLGTVTVVVMLLGVIATLLTAIH